MSQDTRTYTRVGILCQNVLPVSSRSYEKITLFSLNEDWGRTKVLIKVNMPGISLRKYFRSYLIFKNFSSTLFFILRLLTVKKHKGKPYLTVFCWNICRFKGICTREWHSDRFQHGLYLLSGIYHPKGFHYFPKICAGSVFLLCSLRLKFCFYSPLKLLLKHKCVFHKVS